VVTLIRPAGVATAGVQDARNDRNVEPQASPPVYSPEGVAEAIVDCAEHPARDLLVGRAAPAQPSPYPRARLHPLVSTALAAGVGLAVAAGVRRLRGRNGN
jgi:hypothetical protein